MLAFFLIFLTSSQLTSAQRSRRTAPTRRNSASTNTDLTNDQALRIAAILQGATASFAPGEQPTREQLNSIARTQIDDILNVLTPAQKRQIGYGVQIVDPESGIDFVAKIPCINPDFVNALRQEIRYLLRGDPESVRQAAAVLHPSGPYEYITVLKQPCGNMKAGSDTNTLAGKWQILPGSYYAWWPESEPERREQSLQENAGWLEDIRRLGPGHYHTKVKLGGEPYELIDLYGSDTKASGDREVVYEEESGQTVANFHLEVSLSDGTLHYRQITKQSFRPRTGDRKGSVAFFESYGIAAYRGPAERN